MWSSWGVWAVDRREGTLVGQELNHLPGRIDQRETVGRAVLQPVHRKP